LCECRHPSGHTARLPAARRVCGYGKGAVRDHPDPSLLSEPGLDAYDRPARPEDPHGDLGGPGLRATQEMTRQRPDTSPPVRDHLGHGVQADRSEVAAVGPGAPAPCVIDPGPEGAFLVQLHRDGTVE